MRALRRIYYLLAFLIFFGLTCCLLASPRLERYFYPLYFRAEISAAAQEQQLDPYLIAAVILTESNFRENAVSPKGARGLMQLLPSTAEWIAEKNGESDFHPDKLFEPGYNIAAGSRYLAELLKQFNDNEVMALAAYNGGRGRVQHWLEEGTWDGSEANLEQVPFGETRAFVRRTLKNYRNYRRLYGNEWEIPSPAPAYKRSPGGESRLATAYQEEIPCMKLL